MLIDKEYPATHSMSTAWYCVDEDGNVGIFDIDDNGPVPVGGYEQNCVEEVFLLDFSHKDKLFKRLKLRPEQIPQMLQLTDIEDKWAPVTNESGLTNSSWMDVIVQIDMSKFDILQKALAYDDSPIYPLICLSEEQGLFFVDFFDNKQGVDLLEKNDVIKAKYKAPYYNTPYKEDDKDEVESFKKVCQKFPCYIYRQNYWPFHDPALRVNNPRYPLRIEQLPEDVRNKVRILPVKFSETERIQLAELLPVEHIWSERYVYDNKIWWELMSSEYETIYYNETTHRIISKKNMDKYLSAGLAEEWDYHKHHKIEE